MNPAAACIHISCKLVVQRTDVQDACTCDHAQHSMCTEEASLYTERQRKCRQHEALHLESRESYSEQQSILASHSHSHKTQAHRQYSTVHVGLTGWMLVELDCNLSRREVRERQNQRVSAQELDAQQV